MHHYLTAAAYCLTGHQLWTGTVIYSVLALVLVAICWLIMRAVRERAYDLGVRAENAHWQSYLAKALTGRTVTVYAVPGTQVLTVGKLAQPDQVAASVAAAIAAAVEADLQIGIGLVTGS